MSSDSGSSISAGEDQKLAIDQRQQVLQAEQEGTQKRTFSNWINSKLSKHQQQSNVRDLYTDFQDGHILLDLLEVLSGEVLQREKGKNIFQARSNIESALAFLGNRSIKLINIHVEDIISGKPSIVLGLIWQIILHFHIEGLASILAASEDPQSVESDIKKEVSPTASPAPKRSAKSRWKISAKKVLLQWAQEQCARVGSIHVTDFKSSWKNGQAFLAIIHSLRPDLIDMEKFRGKSNEEKLQEAFRIAENELKIPRLIEPEDVNVLDPDEKSIMTYVAQFLQYSKDRADPTKDTTDRVRKAMEWLRSEEQTLKKLFSEMKDETYTKKYQEILLFMRRFNEQKRLYMSDLAVESLQSEEQRLIKQSLENITFQIAEWKEQLDRSLPPPLDAIESWISEVENLMSQSLPESGSHQNAMSLLQALSVSFKALMIRAASHSESLRVFKNVDDNGVILVPADKMEEMRTRMEKILATNFIVLVDYRLSGHYVLALLEEGRPKLKAWKGKYKSQEAVESLIADYNEFVGEKQFMDCLESAFHKFRDFHQQLLTTDDYSDDPEIAKQYKVIQSKYEAFVTSTLEAKSTLEKVITCWLQFENNIGLITAWLDEQHKIHPGHVPMEILSKWKSVHKSLNRDGSFLIERTNEKSASKLSRRLKSLNTRWAKYLKLYEEQRNVGNGNEGSWNPSDEVQEGDSTRQREVSAGTLRAYIQTLQKKTKAAKSIQAGTDILTHLERLEKLADSVNIWTEGAQQVLTTIHPQESLISNIQHFYEKGICHQEELAEAELTIQAVAHLILSHKDLQHFSADSLRKNIVQAHEKVQEMLSRLGLALHPPEKNVPGEDIKIHFERSKRDLETYITNAMLLLGQKVTPEEFISQYEKNVGRFSIQNLEKFLKAADQMRAISSDKEKLAIDVVSADLRHRWKVVHSELESYVSELKHLIQKQRVDRQSTKLKSQISKAVQQNGASIPEDTELQGSTTDKLLQIHEAQKNDLELILQRAREKLVAESPREAQDVPELQSRCQELQTLQAQLKKSWRRLESMSLIVEKRLDGQEKTKCSDTRSALQSGVEEITEEMATRIQSLTITINVLLPIEQDVSVLCESDPQSPVQAMEEFTVSGIGSVCQDLQEFQSSVEDQIQQCDVLESAVEFVDLANPVDAQAIQSIVQQYKIQLEATSDTAKGREALLKDLELFLSSLATTKWSIQAVAAVSGADRTTVLQKRRNIELLEMKVHKLRIEAEDLDDHLVPAEIHLEDPEYGGETSCQKLVDGFFKKIEIAKQAVFQELYNLDTQDSGLPPLNGTLNSDSPSEDNTASGISDQLQEDTMETFTVSKINSVLQEIKEVQNTFENEIQRYNSLDSSVSEPTLNEYKLKLQASSEVIREREATLTVLGNFLSSLKVAKASIEAESTGLDVDRETLLQKQRNLEELEKDIYCLGQEAEKLDDKLQSCEITLEDPDNGGATSCQKMISIFFDKLELAQQAVLRELQNSKEREALEGLISRQRVLCKHIEDIHDQIDIVGLRDPTIHAVQQRLKSLIQLEKKLESFISEKISISNAFLELPQTVCSKDICTSVEECEMLWEDVTQNITHSKEQCEAVIELLRKFQNYKKELTPLIQKAETLLPCQASYIGKENLQKILEKVNSVKQEFDDHSEDIDEISRICKKLQFQMNQIKSFAESPFQFEANAIIDKWLDMTEKLESYHENLKSAISMWSKILHLSEDIEQWSEFRNNVFETSDLTMEDVLRLTVEAENRERHLEEISRLSREIQNLLQIDELPLELQLIHSSLQSKITLLSKFATTKADIFVKSPITAVRSPPTTSIPDGEYVQTKAARTGEPAQSEQCVNGGPEKYVTPHKKYSDTQKSERWQGSATSELKRVEFQTDLRPDLSEVQKTDQLGTLHVKLSELKKRRESLNTEMQPGQPEKERQLASFSLLLQEGQELDGSLKKINSEKTGSDGSSQDNQWLEITQHHDSFMRELQDTVQMLGSRTEGHRRYDSLSSALNNKMTSFYEELLNFAGSSRESAPCEQKRKKLQELRGQYEVLQKGLAEVFEVAEDVKQSTSTPGVTRIQEALDMHHCKLRGYWERLDYLKEAIEQPPLVDKSKKKKPKKGTKKKTGHAGQSTSEPSFQPSEQHSETSPVTPVVESPVEFPSKAAIDPSGLPVLEVTGQVPDVMKSVPPSVQSIDELRPEGSCEKSPGAEHITSKPSVHLTGKPSSQPAPEPLLHARVDVTMRSSEVLTVLTVDATTVQTDTESSVHLVVKPSVPPAAKPVTQSSGKPCLQAEANPIIQALSKPTAQLDERSLVQLPSKPTAQAHTSSLVQLPSEPTAQLGESLLVQPPSEATTQPDESSLVHPLSEPIAQVDTSSSVQPPLEPTAQLGESLLVQLPSEPIAQADTSSSVQPPSEPTAQLSPSSVVLPPSEPTAHADTSLSMQPPSEPTAQPGESFFIQPASEPTAQTDTSSSMQPPPEPTAQLSPSSLVQLPSEPTAQADTSSSVQPPSEPTAQPGESSLVQPISEPTAQPGESSLVQPISEPTAQPGESSLVQPISEPTAQPGESSLVQPPSELTAQADTRSSMQPPAEPTAQPGESSLVQPISEPTAQPGESSLVQPPSEPTAQTVASPSTQPPSEPTAQLGPSSLVHPPSEPTAQPGESPSMQPPLEPMAQADASSSMQPPSEPTAHPAPSSLVQPPSEPTAQKGPSSVIYPPSQPDAPQGPAKPLIHPAAELELETSMQFIAEPFVSTEKAPSLPSVVDVLGPPAVEHIPLTVESAEKHLPQLAVAGLTEDTSVGSSGVLDPDTQALSGPSEVQILDTIHALETAEQDGDNHTLHIVVEDVVHNVLEQAVQDSVILTTQEAVGLSAQDKEDLTKPQVSTLPDVSLCEPADQPPVQPRKMDNTKERKGPKGRSKEKKKKKLVAASHSADKQAVNGLSSPEKTTSSSDHSKEHVGSESVQKKIKQEASDSLLEVAKVKALEECVKVTEEQQEAIGQRQMRLDDFGSFRRQMETLLSDSVADSNDSLRVFSLITTVEERLRQAERLSDDGERVVILNEVQLLYDEIKSYVEGLSDVAASIPRAEEEEKVLGVEFEDTLQVVSDPHKPPTKRDVVNEAQCALEAPPHYAQVQQQIRELLSNIPHIGGDRTVTEKTLEKFANRIKILCVQEDKNIESEGSQLAVLERGIKTLRKHTFKLDITELEQQIEDIEKLNNDVSIITSQETAVQTAKDAESRGSELLRPKCEALLNELTTQRTEKNTLCQALRSFQDALCAARQSYQMLFKEKENLKMAPTENHTSQLNKIMDFLNKVEKEKVILHTLKAEQANIGQLQTSRIEKDRMDTEVNHIEDLWEQIEVCTHRDRDRLIKEAEELASLKVKVDDVQSIIRVQQDLLDQPTPSAENVFNASLGLYAEVQSIKHWLKLLRNACDSQMKRTWGGNEQKYLESSLDSLQNELEHLEERMKDRQLTRCQTPDAILEQYPSLKPVFRSLLWVKKSQEKHSTEKCIALLLEDIGQQTASYQKVHQEVLDRESAIGESKHISSSFDGAMAKDFSSFLQQLQELYQEQIRDSTSRLQQLEIGQEKRKSLFSEIEKLKELLQCLEREATPVKKGIFTATELCEQLNCLKAKTTEMEEIEGLVMTLLRNSQSYHGELKSSEQLYLNDILRSLKSKARRIRRLEEKTFCYTKKLLSICNEFQERLTSLRRNMNAMLTVEPKVYKEASERDGEVSEKELQLSPNAISSCEDHLSQILRYKDLFKDNRLYWDDMPIDDLQKSCVSLTERNGHSEHCGPGQRLYQELLDKISTMVCSLQKEYDDTLAANFDVIAAQVLCKKIKKIGILMAEALGWLHSEQSISVDPSRGEEQSLSVLAENLDRSYQALSQAINEYYDKRQAHHVKETFSILSRIDGELQEPFVNELDENKLQERLLRLEALGEISRVEVERVSSLPASDDLREHLQEVVNTGQHVEKRLSERMAITKQTYDNLQNLHEAVIKVAEHFKQYEEELHLDPIIPSSSGEKTQILDSKQQEFNVIIEEIQNVVAQLKLGSSTENQSDLDDILNQINNKNFELAELRKRKQRALDSYNETYQIFRNNKQKILEALEEIEIAMDDSFLQKPASYKGALEQWEKSKNLIVKIQSYEDKLLELHRMSGDLTTKDNDDPMLEKAVSLLCDRWLYLLGIARDLELYCDELKQEWKFINELLEREVILLDNCQEEVLDRPEIKQRTLHLQNSLADIERFEENVQAQQRQLWLLTHRTMNISGTPGSGPELVAVIQEIQSMQAKCQGLLQKAQKNKQEIEAELQEREKLNDEISVVITSARDVSSQLESMEVTDVAETKILLEELVGLVDSEKAKAQVIMEKLKERYPEAIPEELQTHAEQCQIYLQETEDKVKNEIDQCSPQAIMTRKVNEITAGLKNIEAQITVKTENIFQAKELQKNIWDEVDRWHSKLHALESEVQDLAEEDPSLAQEWMDKMTEPFNYYQQVSYLVEHRTANINKAASKLEEYEDTLKSTKLWIQNTDGLLNEEMKDCSAKVLNKHFNALAIALDDSDGKQLLLDTISSELGELAAIFDTDKIVESLGEERNQVKDLQQRILNVLPQIQHLANEVASIENEVKRMEKRVASIRTILTSSEIDDMSPKEHHKNGQVILENIDSIRGTVADIEAYRPALPLSVSGVQSLCVFRRMGRLLREAEVLEKVTKEQNKRLQPIIIEMSALEQEQEKLKHFSKTSAYESPDLKDRTEELRKLMDGLNQKKEAILLSQRSLVVQQLIRLQEEPEVQSLESLLSPVTEGVDSTINEMYWNDPSLLPSLVEEVEEPSILTEPLDKVTDEAVDLDVKDKEDANNFFTSPACLDHTAQGQLENAIAVPSGMKPEMILRDCQGKVTEVELWLQTVYLSLQESKREADMLQSLDQKLVEFQKTLQETEKKVNSLLEGVDYKKQGPASLLVEAETLSRKLKALKLSLENLQEILQVKPRTDQVKSAETMETQHPEEKGMSNQEIVATLQTRNAAGEVVAVHTRPRGKSTLPDDITWSKWQYLQKELSHRNKAATPKPDNEFEVEKEGRISFISRFSGRTLKAVHTEDSKQYLTRLQALGEEAAAHNPEEHGIHLHSTLFVWLCSVSQWLQKVEEMLDTDISMDEASSESACYEKLAEDLHCLSEEMRKKMDCLLKLISHEGENVGVLSQCYNDIRNWLVQTHGAVLSRTKRIHEEVKKHNNYQNDVRQVYDMLVKKKTVLQQLGNRSDCGAAELLKESATYETELENIEHQVSMLAEKGEKMSIPLSSNQEVHKLQDVLDDTWRIIRVKQDEYSGALIAKSQLDSLLCGVKNLLSFGKEKVSKSKGYKWGSKDALNSHIEEHKNFFNVVESQVLLLQALSSKSFMPPNSKQIAETVVQEADLLIKHAECHCVDMMAVMKEWDEFNTRHDDLSKQMEAVESTVPTKNLVEESEERVKERFHQYQQIQVFLDENEPRWSGVVVQGKRLQSLVHCRGLDPQVFGMEQQWSQLTQKVSHGLHRLESLGGHLASYNRDSAKLSAWLSSANQKLNNFRTRSLDVSQDLDTIKDNLHKFYEFTFEVDEKSSLKTSVLNTGTQLLRLKEADPAMLKLSLAKYKEQWAEIIAALPPVQEKLQQLLLEKLPSLQAIQEVMDWMRNVEQSTPETVPTTSPDIQSLLQKYKNFQKEMSHKQCIVDFVNQSLLQLSVGDVEGKRYERAELAELLGSLNLQWNTMHGDLNRKIQNLEQTLESISEQESRRQSINNWFDVQQVRLNKLQRPSSLTAAESVLAECSELEKQTKAKSSVLEELERSTAPAGHHSFFKDGILSSQILVKKRDALVSQTADLKTSIHSMLGHWKTFSKNYECVKNMLVKLLYVLGQAQRPISSFNCVKHRMEILQSAQEEAEKLEENWIQIKDAMRSMNGLCNPSVCAILEQDCKEAENRWTSLNEQLSSHLQSAGLLLQLWEAYNDSYQNHTKDMEQLEGKCQQLLYAKLSEDRQADTLQQRIQDLQVMEQSLQALRAHNLQVSELADKVIRQDSAAADVIHSERQNTSHRIDHLEKSVSSKTAELKLIQNEVETFKKDLEKLQSCVKSSADFVGHVCLSQKEKEERSEHIKKHLLELRERTADIERLNEEIFTLPLDDRSLMMLQNLNRSWEKTGEMALEDCREHRVKELDKNSFIQNYETWTQCVEKMESNLTTGIAGTFEALKGQQAMYEKLQAEIAINEHILPSFMNKALSVLESEEEQHRSEVILKLTSLKEKWQNVISLVQQRNQEISVLLKQWWQFRVCNKRLEKNLSGVQAALSSVTAQKCHSLINAEKLLYSFKEKERHLKRQQPIYDTTVENGKELLAVADPETKEAVQRDLTVLQDMWQNTTLQLQAILTHLSDMALKRENFQQSVEDRRTCLHGLKRRVDAPLPTRHEDLQRCRLTVKELEEALDEWGDSLKELDNMKAELSQYIIAEDGVVLKKQVEALHKQWEELCLRVSMRKQEIEDRLNAWNVFNEKNKELCDWLTQMESKVLQTADVNIEEMIEKLQKDCIEEINLFSENKLHLKQIGDQLIIASNKARSTEIENKLNKVNDRWKHLFDVIGSRVKKLKETLVIIQQLDKNMSNLRTWLSRIESELSKPVIYSICDDQEINKKLEEQRDLQKDIELHSAGVASVLNICERLLHDTDACANETECDSIQQTTRSLDKRWRNICTMSMERRLRIEETWRLWQKFLEDYSKFDDWLKEAEAMAASPSSSDVLYTKAKEEQKKFEAFQRQIHERLTHLELINKQYRRLARENRTDAASRLKQMVHDGNQRWDQLQRRVAAILRRLKHFTSQREDFEGTRDSILVWLTEMDLQLTNVEHFSESDIEEKMQQLVGFKQEITLNTNKIDQLIVFGEQLIQKSEAMDAVVIEDELEEIHRYCQEVFGRVYRFHERLTSKGLNLEEERETSENDTDEDSRELQNSSWHSTIPDVDTSHQSLCHLMPPPLPHERSGRETPVSVDSIPLEWDPTVDVGGSSMNENEEESAYYNPLTGKSDLETPSWHSPDKRMAAVIPEYKHNEPSQGRMTASPKITASPDVSTNEQTSTPSRGSNLRTSGTSSEQLDDEGLRGIYGTETHSGVIERWEIIQAQSLSNEFSAKQNLQQWQQFNSDLDNISLWLQKTEAELDNSERLKPSASIQELEQKVKRFKDTLKAFDNYKALVLSANLSSKEFQHADDADSGNLLRRLHEVNSRWDHACRKRDKWRENLQDDLNQCEEFHETSHRLLLWLTEAEARRVKYQVANHKSDQQALLECQRNLMQLEEQLLEKRIQAKSLQDMSSYLSGSNAGGGYVEAEERTHVIATKMKQLLKEVSRDVKAAQRALEDCASDEVDSVASADRPAATGTPQETRTLEQSTMVQETKKRSFFYRVLRAALPLQLLLLLLLLLACMIPFSEDDYSCAQANNFARSFYPMLRYTNGPPPT